MIGDFNVKSSNWSFNDITTAKFTEIDYLISLYIMKQVITEPINTLENSSSCIDLIFPNQPNLIVDSGVHLALHLKYHLQIIYSKLNLKTESPPSDTRKTWDYNRSETDLIINSIEIFDWSNLYLGKTVQ